jgi:hypothetical protein
MVDNVDPTPDELVPTGHGRHCDDDVDATDAV